jgi:AbrB family looped-hinge helix DNA binding protein
MPIVKASSKYQVAIPKQIRTKLHIKPGQEFVLSDKDGSVVLTPVPEDPIEALCGYYKGGPSMTKELLEERARDLEHE